MDIVITIENGRNFSGLRVLHRAHTSYIYPEVKFYFLADLQFCKWDWLDRHVDSNIAKVRLSELLKDFLEEDDHILLFRTVSILLDFDVLYQLPCFVFVVLKEIVQVPN